MARRYIDPWEDGDKFIDVEAIRAQTRKLTNAELIREGKAARQLATPYYGRTPRQVFVVGLGRMHRGMEETPSDLTLE